MWDAGSWAWQHCFTLKLTHSAPVLTHSPVKERLMGAAAVGAGLLTRLRPSLRIYLTFMLDVGRDIFLSAVATDERRSMLL